MERVLTCRRGWEVLTRGGEIIYREWGAKVGSSIVEVGSIFVTDDAERVCG
jgi:hypothetical protein